MPFSEIPVSELVPESVEFLLDVRETDEYESGHVPGAVNLPLSSLVDNTGSIPTTGTVHVVCQAGGRSARACEFLSQQPAFASVSFVNVAGGTGGWIIEGGEIVSGDSPR